MNETKRSSGIGSTSNFCAHRLIFSPEKVMVKPTAGNYMFFSVFVLIGVGLAAAVWCAEGEMSARIGITLFGMIFAGAGFWGMFRKNRRLPEIDLVRRMFYPERCKYDPADLTDLSGFQGIPLSELVEIRVSSRRVSGKKSSYTAFILELVFRDGYSCRLLSHGGYRQFVEDAEKLAEILNIQPVGLAEIKRSAASGKAAGIAQLAFGTVWLILCFSAMGGMIVPELKKFDGINTDPEILIRIIFPSVFILVGVVMIAGGIKNVVKSLKKQ